MNSESLQLLGSQIEALLLASDEPLSLARLRGLLEEEIQSSDIREAIAELESFYQNRGIQITQVAGGWQFRTTPEHAELIHQLWEIKPQKLSRSAMETLAIIAYRQPTTRAEIEALRGVKVSSQMIATLQERGWIKVLGRKEVPGRPHLYGTGKLFLVDFGLESLKDLPDSAQLMDEDEIQQMVIGSIEQHEHEEAETGAAKPDENTRPDKTANS
ncbi:segregation and condensation protein B [Mariprofundus micogutta]|uniref:Segregation and condensation protein B n=1 Tax=Mariprofundus micogutta TaxID=1921010 RepID=A0A1L8CJM0_9PROT|nr:SMC-Scp complex subunit ScpB [Mariprofundus micogutta]GAV19085.1 segregation and condensation protein B [Mariprofundus micogutta]